VGNREYTERKLTRTCISIPHRSESNCSILLSIMEKGDIAQIETSFSKTALDHKVKDGDDALQILHAEFEPYTKEEEKRVLRKIDFRLVILMLIINGIQFVDKTVFLKATLI
jgi:hypothetical protein